MKAVNNEKKNDIKSELSWGKLYFNQLCQINAHEVLFAGVLVLAEQNKTKNLNAANKLNKQGCEGRGKLNMQSLKSPQKVSKIKETWQEVR